MEDAAKFSAALSERGVESAVEGHLIQLRMSAAEAVRVAVEVGVEVLTVAPATRSLEALYDEMSTAEFESEVAA